MRIAKKAHRGHRPEVFPGDDRRGVYRAIYKRRDVRSRFLPRPVPDAVIARMLDAAHHAPSVGFMQPWDFILIRDANIRSAVHQNFLQCNARAAEAYEGDSRRLYDSLTLAAILEAPLNLCVTCDHNRRTGNGLGRHSISETDVYSTVCAVQNLWLAACAEGIGVGWVSILDRDRLRTTLHIPSTVTPVAYLCVGYVAEFQPRPELQERGWAGRESLARLIHFEHWEGQDTGRAADLIRSVVDD